MQSRWEHKHPESLKRLMAWMKEVSESTYCSICVAIIVTQHLALLRVIIETL